METYSLIWRDSHPTGAWGCRVHPNARRLWATHSWHALFVFWECHSTLRRAERAESRGSSSQHHDRPIGKAKIAPLCTNLDINDILQIKTILSIFHRPNEWAVVKSTDWRRLMCAEKENAAKQLAKSHRYQICTHSLARLRILLSTSHFDKQGLLYSYERPLLVKSRGSRCSRSRCDIFPKSYLFALMLISILVCE